MWREGLAEWKKIFEIPELRDVFQESTNEVKEKAVKKQDEENKSEESNDSEVEDFGTEFCYYNRQEKVYKVF